MKKSVLTALAFAALGGSALAADLPSRKGPVAAPVYAPIFTWTGFYVGVNAGGMFTDNEITLAGTSAFTANNVAIGARPFRVSREDSGFIGGGQIGYNYQIGQIVLGVEADLQYTDIGQRTAFVGSTGATALYRQDLDYLGTVRGRVGYAFDRALVYATAGLAYGDVSYNATFQNAAIPARTDYFGRRSDVEIGYTVGGGIEYAITNNLSVKAEYLYYDLGKKRVPVVQQQAAAALPAGDYVARFKTEGHIVRAGLNYRFNTW